MLLLLVPGSQLLLYPVLWLLMPDEADVTHHARTAGTRPLSRGRLYSVRSRLEVGSSATTRARARARPCARVWPSGRAGGGRLSRGARGRGRLLLPRSRANSSAASTRASPSTALSWSDVTAVMTSGCTRRAGECG